jgi:hypothetical protein
MAKYAHRLSAAGRRFWSGAAHADACRAWGRADRALAREDRASAVSS